VGRKCVYVTPTVALAERRLVVGREAELDSLDRFFELGAGPRTLLLSGGAGIGKTTVWEAGVDLAQARGMRILVARPSEAEKQLALAALGDLLDGVDDGVLAQLPPPQAHALEVALLRREGEARPPEPRAIAAGVLGLLRTLAHSGTVLVAIDDAQWLDAASDAALSFVLRRLDGERVRLLLSQRAGSSSLLIRTLDNDRTQRIELGGLSFGAIRSMLVDRLGSSLPRRMVRQLYESSQGNPLFALEIGRALAERATHATGEPLPVPADVHTLVGERISRLPAATRQLLLAAALLARAELATLQATVGGDIAADLGPAEQAGIAGIDGECLVFSHPLHAAGVVAAVTDMERREMHRRLAETAPKLEERARHMARGAEGADEQVARILDAGAAAARARGALHAAAELLERASELTPTDDRDAAQARRIEAVDLHFHAGDPAHARGLLQATLSEQLADSRRAEALRLLAEISISEEKPSEAEQLLVEALALSEDDRSRARIELELTYVSHFSLDFARGAEHARRGLALVRDTDDEPLLAEALSYCAMADYLAGHGVDWAKIERALELEDPDRISLPGLPPSGIAGLLLMFTGRHSEARDLMRATCSRLSDRGQENDLAHALLWWSWLETKCANFTVAASFADESIAYASLGGNQMLARWATAQRGWVDAHLGEDGDARQRIAESLRGGGDGSPSPLHNWTTTAIALLEASVPDHASAWEACRPLVEMVEAHGIGEPVLMCLPDAIEALVGLGELERAEAILDQFETSGRALDRIWALATAARCRGQLHAARGEVDAAFASFEDALRQHERIELPFERARTLLALGAVQRRSRRRGQARAVLEEAAGEFERMGAKLWAKRARAELDRISGRRRNADGALTPSELRVVELAADGLSNKEIAARLVVSIHTVEVHLSHAYRKLGVRSRAQLAPKLWAPSRS
jgi:DNA-binding CsgD family transcriptional regulator